MNRIEKSVELFNSGFLCSQAVFAAFSKDLGLSEEQALKIGACFGSGMRKGEVCGACTGALMVLGLKYGYSNADDKESKIKADKVCDKFLDEFKKENGSYLCRELLDCDISTPELLDCDISTPEGKEHAIENNLFSELCPKMVKSAATITEKLI